MGNADTKLNFRKAVVQLTTKTQPVEAGDEAFWNQFWSESVTCVQDVFTLIPAAEIRALREESPSNLATLCYKAVEKLVAAAENNCRTQREQQTVLNCVRLLTRILPYIFEDPDWRGFFWSTLPGQSAEDATEQVISGENLEDEVENESPPLAQSLLNALSDLLFCPDFTVSSSSKKSGPESPEEINTIDSCEYIWEAGVGFAHSPTHVAAHDHNRTEILKLLLTCFSESMYLPPIADAHIQPNQWIGFFTSTENRHALPLFTSLLNLACSYDPIGYGVPYNHLMFTDSREPLVEVALQVLCVTLDQEPSANASVDGTANSTAMETHSETSEGCGSDNLFTNYLSRIHREEDFAFILKGITRLLNNPLVQTYLPGSCKKIQFHQELFVLFWKMCDINKKFMFYVLKSSDVLDILVPILYHLNDARADQSRVGLMHIGVFILLLLSGERNFGVRLNKPYTVRVPMDIPVFTGTHADFLIIVFHKIITTGHQRLQPLFDCLLTIIVNVSPYLKTLSMVASTKLLHLLEAFSTPWFLYASPTNHHLVFFLLEVFNNIIQYQFDGNANLVYTIIRKRTVFHQLANLPIDHSAIAKALTKRGKKVTGTPADQPEAQSMEGSIPATDAEPGTLKASLAALPVVPSLNLSHNAYGTSQSAILTNEETSPTEILSPSSTSSSSSSSLPSKHYHPSHMSKPHPGGIKTPTTHSSSCNPAMTLSSYLKNTLHNNEDNSSEFKMKLAASLGIDKMTEKSPASAHHNETPAMTTPENAEAIQQADDMEPRANSSPDGASADSEPAARPPLEKAQSLQLTTPPSTPTEPRAPLFRSATINNPGNWVPTPDWVQSWKQKLPLQTIMRLLQVLVPQVEKICIDKGLTDESEILKFLQHGTLVGLLPVPHPILIRKYQANSGTTMWFRTYMWGVIYLRNVDPPIWYDTDVKLFEIQRV